MNPVVEALMAQGVLGAIVVILGVAYWIKDKENKKIQEDRLQDAKDMLVEHNNLVNQLKEITQSILNQGGGA